MEISKREVERIISEGNLEESLKAIRELEEKTPQDAEILSLKTLCYTLADNLESALKYAEEAVRRLPLNGEMQYNLGCVYDAMGRLEEAYVCYIRSSILLQYSKSELYESLGIMDASEDLINRIIAEANDDNFSLEDRIRKKTQLEYLLGLSSSQFLLLETAFRNSDRDLIGQWYYESLTRRRFAGIYKDQYFNSSETPDKRNVVELKAEFLEGTEGQQFTLEGDCEEYILPVASFEPTNLQILTPRGETLVRQRQPYRFYYYRLPGNASLQAGAKSVFGHPIPLRRDPQKKRLVMSIFVDGLSNSILKGDLFRQTMPHTCEYFSKGTIFENAFNTGEWTYPSIATYVTGLYTTHHMLFHHTLDYPMPEQVPTLAEHFRDAGYYTSKYCGNWRIIPSYGHARGYDRFVYQHQSVGFKAHEVVAEAIDQLDAGKELNQYVWISIGDLHDIADRFQLPLSVQKNLPIESREYQESGPTSVKQTYNRNDVIQYKEMAGYIDRWLHILFRYIEENYADDEVVISLFSDHGQGYLIEGKNAHFLAKERSNVPMMFRGGISEGRGVVEETVSAVDYSCMLRKVAGLPETDESGTDAQLPVIFGGRKAREYAYSESIHPGDPYRAAVYSPRNNEVFFFKNPTPVLNDGRFALVEYAYCLETIGGSPIRDAEREKQYLNIVLDHIAPILLYD